MSILGTVELCRILSLNFVDTERLRNKEKSASAVTTSCYSVPS